MKRALLPLLLVFLLPLAACDSSDGGDGDGPGSIPGTAADATITWRAGGTTYSAEGDNTSPLTGAAVATYTASGVGGVPLLSLNATAIQGTTPSSLTILANGVGGEGTFSLSPTEGSLMAFVLTEVSGTSATTTSYVGTSGTITVSEMTDTGARGTFSFDGENQEDASDTVSISNGSFAVAFTN